MSVSSIGSRNGAWYLARVFQQGKGAQTRRPSLQADLGKLSEDLQSGDLEAARADLATITSRMPDKAHLPHSDVAKAIEALGAALESGDVEATKAALATVQDALAKHAADAPPPPPPPDPEGGGTTEATPGTSLDPLAQVLDSMKRVLDDGDVEGATSLYELLREMMEEWTAVGSDAAPAGTAASGRVDLVA